MGLCRGKFDTTFITNDVYSSGLKGSQHVPRVREV